jgi:hypothetical protein
MRTRTQARSEGERAVALVRVGEEPVYVCAFFGISGRGWEGVRDKEPDGGGVEDDLFRKVWGIDQIGSGRGGREGGGEIRGGSLDRSGEDRPCLGRDYERGVAQTRAEALWSISSEARRGNRPSLRVQSKAASSQHIKLGSFSGPKSQPQACHIM